MIVFFFFNKRLWFNRPEKRSLVFKEQTKNLKPSPFNFLLLWVNYIIIKYIDVCVGLSAQDVVEVVSKGPTGTETGDSVSGVEDPLFP